MPDGCVFAKGRKSLSPNGTSVGTQPGPPARGEAGGEGAVVRVEANFLRLPLFALDNKHLRDMDGIRCEGTFRRGGRSCPFSFAATRNAATFYPGPLARSAHFAVLSLATEGGLPASNPIVFTWRELCSRMGVRCSGRTIRELRAALAATKGLLIESRHALFLKTSDGKEEGDGELSRIVGLYDELEFFGARRPDGSRADVNAVWLSRWYLDNLNALYCAPLDYALWRRLNEKSFIASRLYEFLFFKFYAGHPSLRFDYANLVKFVPARLERYASDAKRQLQPAFDVLVESGVLAGVHWLQSRKGAPQIVLCRGPLLARPQAHRGAREDDVADVAEEDFVLRKIENVRSPEWRVVAEFHRLWGRDCRPSKGEMAAAGELLGRHGREQIRAVLPSVVRRMRQQWPDAKTFGAAARYLDAAVAERLRHADALRARRQEEAQQQNEQEESDRRAQERDGLKPLWQSLSEAEREAVRRHVLAGQPRSLAKHPALLERFCLEELRRRRAGDSPG
jgi:hypothetical protein